MSARSPSRTLLIMAAGTGGHIMPGLAVADAMRARGWQVHWLGTRHGMENRLVPPHQIPLHTVSFSGLRGKGWRHTVAGVFKLLAATLVSWRLMGKLRPAVVLGMGGYATVPGGWAARLRRAPLAVVNADASLLLSNQALAAAAQRVLFGFAGDYGRLAAKAKHTGNPVRQEIVAIAQPSLRFAGRTGPLRLLVVGGSLGAQVLNQTLPKALALLAPESRPQVLHQAGQPHVAALQAAYRQAGVEAEVLPFIDDMARRYAEADLLVCRAGAITVSELAVVGVASILVPLTVSTTSHQRDNAAWMAAQGAAIHLPQPELTPERLATWLRELDREALLRMAQAAYRLGRRDATDAIATELENMAGA